MVQVSQRAEHKTVCLWCFGITAITYKHSAQEASLNQ